MDETIDKQVRVAGHIERTVENLKRLGKSNITLGVLEAKLSTLEDKWKEFQATHEVLLAQATKAELEKDYFKKDYASLTEDYYFIQKGKLLDLIRQYSTPAQQTSSVASAEPMSRQQLPKINLPKFSGEFAEWLTFKDLSESMIIQNRSLTPVERLQYLKMSVQKEPAALLASIPITSDNFQIAWQTLNDRYGNVRLLVNAQISNLFALPAVSSESSAELKSLFNGTTNALGALESLGRSVDGYSDLIVYMTVQKLDQQSRREWEAQVGSQKEPPKVKELTAFLANRICSVEALECSAKSLEVATATKASSASSSRQSRPSSALSTQQSVKSHVSNSAPQVQKCSFCQQAHYIVSCEAFRAKSAEARRAFVLTNNLCLNCLGRHYVRECRSKKTCLTCRGKHHTMLHEASSSAGFENRALVRTAAPSITVTPRPDGERQDSTPTAISHNVALSLEMPLARALLATALVSVSPPGGGTSLVRALIDQGSEASFVAESLAQRLRLPRSSASVVISGIGGLSSTAARGVVSLSFSSRVDPKFKCRVDALVLPQLTAYAPSSRVAISRWSHLHGLALADPDFSSTQPVELLLGADVYSRLILSGIRKGSANEPVAQNTHLGWILSGKITADSSHGATLSSLQISLDDSLSSSLQRFWDQEELSSPCSQLRPEEQECEDYFLNTHSRNEDGRYVVRLPLKGSVENLGDSLTPASRMLQRMESRFARDSSFYGAYSAFMAEYEDLKHMELVSPFENTPKHVFYLPHHGVIRESSTTTRLRVVFNGSQKTDSGISLNDYLHVGPKILPDLVDVLLRWRSHAIVFSADMEKMYRQILVHEDDRDLQRILWRESPTSDLKTYRLCTVTYGLASAPFLAIRVIKQLALDEKERFPVGSSSLSTDVYVDDVLSSADDVPSALHKQQEIINLLKAGGFHLRKWTSNSPALLDHLPPDSTASASSLVWQPEVSFHVLGLTWQASSDSFMFSLKDVETPQQLTKRNVLSRIAQLFDPLGWLAPIIVAAKIFMQSLWLLKLGWDDALPEVEARRWSDFYVQLPLVAQFRIPRWLGSKSGGGTCEIHGFADASERAYAAVIYLRVENEGKTSVSLIVAKTKVAPVKQISLPRLELCAAHLTTKLAKHVRGTLQLAGSVHLWSDSTVVLAWIGEHPSRWKTFVANRVSDMQQSLPDAVWHHVDSKQNPADCASRGISVSELKIHPLWWTGPPWLPKPPKHWPISRARTSDALLEVRSSSHAATIELEAAMDLLLRYSDLTRLLRITARCLRVARTKGGKYEPLSPLLPSEIAEALRRLIVVEQRRFFNSELQALSTNARLSRGPLLRLNPFIDGKGQLRVGGRLKNAVLDPDEKNPVILPKDSPLTTLIIDRCHRQTLHGGVQLTLATVRQRYWIVSGRAAVKTRIYRCLKCARFRATAASQLMGNLPKNRVTPCRPFLNAGIDYAGPVYLRTTKGRGHKSYKAYIAIFVCFSTRAVHLEAVSDYTTEGFLAAFRRFTSRRGVCETLSSDCGTNFVGADAELRSLFALASAESQKIATILANDGTEWRFNPPSAPHFGGLWEAAVKLVKHHLRRPLSDDPEDLSALTPAHFLVGSPLTAIPEPSLVDLPASRLSRWELIQQMRRHFWDRWSAEYLHHLQVRPKWQRQQPSLEVGDLVLVKNELLPPTKWPLARIIAVHPGADGHVRVATIKTATSTLTRPIVKLCPLLKSGEAEGSST